MAEFTIDAMIYRDGQIIGSGYGAGSTLAHAVHMVSSDLGNFTPDSDEEGSNRG